ncbi:MAG: imidazole glycerol phosphate synthase subunit HisF [Proteobacteria bacterium]|nr:imidazole glycerol phosphate synthase subunit HisF [Pseudomonadota bacterium]
MLSKRVIACLDVKDGVVVKGVRFQGHEVMGGVLELARRYRDQGADELVFYDITASADGRRVSKGWVESTALELDIPFCVAGGIRSVADAEEILRFGADKVSVNSPALERPELITELAKRFGSQCVVVGVDSKRADGRFEVYKHTGRVETAAKSRERMEDWVREAQERGAGEIVLNCMDADGTGGGYDVEQLRLARGRLSIPLVASGGAKTVDHFAGAFAAGADAALAAGVFHRGELTVGAVKAGLRDKGVHVRL